MTTFLSRRRHSRRGVAGPAVRAPARAVDPHRAGAPGPGFDLSRVPASSRDRLAPAPALTQTLGAKAPTAPVTRGGLAPPGVDGILRSEGRPLEAATRTAMESRFGHDFGRVRLHTGTEAARSARSVNASAYTVGSHIVADEQIAAGGPAGERLLAHELVHVIQQEQAGPSVQGATPVPDADDPLEQEASAVAERITGGGVAPAAQLSRAPSGVLQRQAEPPAEKSSQAVEATYRYGARRLGDPRLREAAESVRRCREQGGQACALLVTDDDLWTMYGQYTLTRDVLGEDVADQAVREFRLAEEAERAKAARESIASGTVAAGTALAGPAATPGAAPAPAPRPLVGLRGGGELSPPRNPPLRVVAPGATPARGPVAEPVGRPGAGIAAVVIVIGVAIAVDLHRFGEFQRKAFDAGYRYLPSPRGVCQRGCHAPAPDAVPRILELPPDVVPAPRTGPLSGREIEEIERWLDGAPSTRLDPAEDRRRRRRRCPPPVPMPPRGGNREHDALAAKVTGAPLEYLVITPEGRAKQFDGMDESETLFDVKTKQDFLQVLGAPESALSVRGAIRLSFGVARLRAETTVEVEIAERCGYQFRIATNNRSVVQHLRDLLGDIIDPENIDWVDFTY